MDAVACEVDPLAALQGLETSERPPLVEVLMVEEVVEAQAEGLVLEDSSVEDNLAELQMTFGLELWEYVLEVDGRAALVDDEVPTTWGAKQ